jgi:hypothetical protein
MEALGADLAGAAFAVEDQRGHLPGGDQRGDDLPSAAVALVDEVPAALARQAEGSNQPPKGVDVAVRDYRDAYVVAGPAAGLVNKGLGAHRRAGRTGLDGLPARWTAR